MHISVTSYFMCISQLVTEKLTVQVREVKHSNTFVPYCIPPAARLEEQQDSVQYFPPQFRVLFRVQNSSVITWKARGLDKVHSYSSYSFESYSVSIALFPLRSY